MTANEDSMDSAIDRIMQTYNLLVNQTAAASAEARVKVTEYVGKLFEAGEKDTHRLTAQGQEIRRIVDALYQKHVKTVEQVGGISNEEFATLNKSLHRLERFWTDQILYRL